MKLKDQRPDRRCCLGYLLFEAIWRLWPRVKFGLYQATERGFYCDVDIGQGQISEKDFGRLEEQMGRAAATDLDCRAKPLEEALAWAKSNDQTYLLDALGGLKGKEEQVHFISGGDFSLPIIGVDPAARGESAKLGAEDLYFKIVGIGGAYWGGEADQPQLQRLQVVVFATAEELEGYAREQKQRVGGDHRQINKEHNFFMFSDLVGSGLPLFQENGAIIRRRLEDFVIDEAVKRGYVHVYTQDITQADLYDVSGHRHHYEDSMYPPIEIDGKEFMLSPMNCPHHFQIYRQRTRSFRELPIRLTEIGKNYRYEQSGELSGLARVRCFSLTDAHIICRPDQVEAELSSALQLIEDAAAALGIEKDKHCSYRLSLGKRDDQKKYSKDDRAWDRAEQCLRGVLQSRKSKFTEVEDEAAFYGPKVDIQMRLAGGKEETALTVQYDFLGPKNFGLTYVDSDDQVREAVVIHHSIIGSIERSLAFLIELYGGKFPVWLSPCQLKILTVGENAALSDYAEDLRRAAADRGVRARIDDSQHSVGKKVAQSRQDFTPYVLVVGEKEMAKQKFKVRIRDDLQPRGLKEGQAYGFEEILAAIDTRPA